MSGRVWSVVEIAAPVAAGLLLLLLLASVWVARVPYAFDLEWMEGGMLAHAWRLDQGLPLYVDPNPDFVPFVYPPGYAVVLAVLGKIFGLSPALGRWVSLGGVLLAAAAIPFVVVRWSKRPAGQPVDSRVIAFAAAVGFLGTYPHGGAFFDLVRPDGLFVGLLAWSIAIGLEKDRRAPIIAGILLWLAFLVKHNAAAYGIPIAIGIAIRSGRREALRFTLAAALPALVSLLYLQLRSGGRFLVYLLQVPASHPSLFERIWPGTPRELGTPLPIAIAVIALWVIWLGMSRQRTFTLPATTFGPIASGMIVAAFGTYVVPPPDSGMYNFPSSIAFFALGAIPVAFGLYLIGAYLDRREWRAQGPILNWRWGYGLGIAGTTLFLSCLMRSHNGGYLNVHIPTFWVICVGFAVVIDRILSEIPTPPTRVVATGVLTAQCLWSVALLDGDRLKPTDVDRALGNRFVARLQEVDGEVLSPFAAWLPTYAGKPPSLHYMAIWDLDYAGGPYRDQLDVIREAVRDHRWPVVLGGTQKFPYGLADHYETLDTLGEGKSPMTPKSGWPARPNRIMVPMGSAPAAEAPNEETAVAP